MMLCFGNMVIIWRRGISYAIANTSDQRSIPTSVKSISVSVVVGEQYEDKKNRNSFGWLGGLPKPILQHHPLYHFSTPLTQTKPNYDQLFLLNKHKRSLLTTKSTKMYFDISKKDNVSKKLSTFKLKINFS